MRFQGQSEIATKECVTSQRPTVLSSPKDCWRPETRDQRQEGGWMRAEARGQRPEARGWREAGEQRGQKPEVLCSHEQGFPLALRKDNLP